MNSIHDLPPPLHLAVLRGEMTVEQARNQLETPSQEDVDRMLDGKPPKDLGGGFTVWPRRSQVAQSPSAEAQRLAPEKVVSPSRPSPARQQDTRPIGQSIQIADLEQRLSELEQIVVDLVDRLTAKGAS